MIFKDQRPRKNLNTLTPSNYSLNKQCSRWWHQKVGCLCSRLLSLKPIWKHKLAFKQEPCLCREIKVILFRSSTEVTLISLQQSCTNHNKVLATTLYRRASLYIYIYTREHIQNIGGDMIRRKYVGYVVIIISFALL